MSNSLSGLAYELLTQAVKNVNITVNLSKKSSQAPMPVPKTEDSTTGLVKTDLVRLIDNLESVSTTLKKIDKNLAGHDHTEICVMLENFDRVLNSIRLVLNSV
ncbi:MAG: hypothetical protein E4H07_09570 [Nitrosomonadales bacterium]|nr:MAG: hypothetical protein E4H07_09570 [Nitrosomonadales bacterium]